MPVGKITSNRSMDAHPSIQPCLRAEIQSCYSVAVKLSVFDALLRPHGRHPGRTFRQHGFLVKKPTSI
jgi:hypothetical protein